MKLGVEELEELREIMSLDGYKILLSELEKLVVSIQAQVLQYDLSNGNDRALAFLKARGEGAVKLFSTFKAHMNSLKSSKAH